MHILCMQMMLGHCISHTNTKYVTYDTLNALPDLSIHALHTSSWLQRGGTQSRWKWEKLTLRNVRQCKFCCCDESVCGLG
jgi:hypothetical protein